LIIFFGSLNLIGKMKTQKYIYITGDTNDGDYVSQMVKIKDSKVEVFKPIIQAIKECTAQYNWACINTRNKIEDIYPQFHEENPDFESEYLPTIEFEDFGCYVPYNVHTITEIKIFTVTNVEELL